MARRIGQRKRAGREQAPVPAGTHALARAGRKNARRGEAAGRT
ncbi:hypothetical protein L494_2613 [Bordetella bronchiseptica CA90 BB1334]|nr:hypothetical protein L576_2722 [Bordetella bronchiseptica OSU054]KDB72419.1 hypothetical protein L494_2613 [Bordetella bronchiseptica CA90 BB1334]KDD41989.1 hypothetical protein L532_2652 [Bordetella bronchiseptica OSU095]